MKLFGVRPLHSEALNFEASNHFIYGACVNYKKNNGSNKKKFFFVIPFFGPNKKGSTVKKKNRIAIEALNKWK